MICVPSIALSPEWLLVLLTLVIACATIYYAVMSKRQWLATQVAIKQTADALELTNRARIVVTDVAIEDRRCIVRLINCGRVPAAPVRVTVSIEPGKRDTPPDFTAGGREFSAVVAPDDEWPLELWPDKDPWAFSPFAEHADGPNALQVFGTITYGDHFNSLRRARFCFQNKTRSMEFEPGAGADYP